MKPSSFSLRYAIAPDGAPNARSMAVYAQRGDDVSIATSTASRTLSVIRRPDASHAALSASSLRRTLASSASKSTNSVAAAASSCLGSPEHDAMHAAMLDRQTTRPDIFRKT